jgi:type IX secretion system PorP/SprF family membrane protein
MKKRLLVLSALVLASTGCFAQQDLALTHFMYNKFAVNPGATGIEDGICGNLIYRNQWDKVNGAPNSAIFNGEMNLSQWLNAGAGINFTHDAIGFSRQNNVSLNFSYHFNLPFGVLGVGAGVGMINFGMDPAWIPPQTLIDGTLPQKSSATNFDANFGVYLRAENWYAGLSSTHLPAMGLKITPTAVPITATTALDYNLARHYYVMGGYTIRNVGSKGEVDIQAMGQTDAVKFTAMLNGRYIYNNLLYGGIGVRYTDAVSVMLGYKFLDRKDKKNARMFGWAGYSYDVSIGRIAGVSKGTHEMSVKFCYIPNPPITKSKHPRWL